VCEEKNEKIQIKNLLLRNPRPPTRYPHGQKAQDKLNVDDSSSRGSRHQLDLLYIEIRTFVLTRVSFASCSDVLHPNRPNVSKDELRQKLSELYKADKDQVSVFGFRTQYGGGKSTGFALIYDSNEAMKKFEPHYRLVRVGMATKIEKPSRQQRMFFGLSHLFFQDICSNTQFSQASSARTVRRPSLVPPRSRVPRPRRTSKRIAHLLSNQSSGLYRLFVFLCSLAPPGCGERVVFAFSQRSLSLSALFGRVDFASVSQKIPATCFDGTSGQWMGMKASGGSLSFFVVSNHSSKKYDHITHNKSPVFLSKCLSSCIYISHRRILCTDPLGII
jgi:small subunit ribosomal protein S24e